VLLLLLLAKLTWRGLMKVYLHKRALITFHYYFGIEKEKETKEETETETEKEKETEKENEKKITKKKKSDF
jgi:hypothetical protein